MALLRLAGWGGGQDFLLRFRPFPLNLAAMSLSWNSFRVRAGNAKEGSEKVENNNTGPR